MKQRKDKKKAIKKSRQDHKKGSRKDPSESSLSCPISLVQLPELDEPLHAPKSSKIQPDKDNWAVSFLVTQRDQKRSQAWKEDKLEVALHHIISKETLSNIVDAFNLTREWHQGCPGARRFWAVCCHLAGPAIQDACQGNPHKLLWNLPVNLEIGPRRRTGDPGTMPDPNTCPDGDDERSRVLDEASEHLLKLHAFYTQHRDKDEPLSDEEWDIMTMALWQAFEANGVSAGTLPLPMTEQWVCDEVTGVYQRRCLRYFPDVDEGVGLFRGARTNREDISAYEGDDTEVRRVEVTIDGATFTVVLDNAAIHHIMRRHTYEQFEIGEAKAINNFWPQGTTFEQVSGTVGDMLEGIAQLACGEIERSSLDDVIGDGQICLQEQQVGDQTIFLIMSIEEDFQDDDQGRRVTGRLETVAPDGRGAHAYTKSRLQDIFAKL